MDSTKKQVGGGATLGLGIVVVWLLGRFGVNMSAEVGAAIGAILLVIFSQIWDEGVFGVFHHLLRGGAESEHSASGESEVEKPGE